MSASTRGILVRAEGSDLLVQASPADVARFSRGQAVDMAQGLFVSVSEAARRLAEEGWRIVPSPQIMNDRSYYPDTRPSSYPVLLRTRCGCEKSFPAEWPPRPEIRVALAPYGPRWNMAADDLIPEQVTVTLRAFRATGHMVEREGVRMREYLEEA